MKLVVIESPYAGDIEANLEYARRAMADSIHRGEAPIASHLLYTQPGVLRDEIPEERRLGIEAGFAWWDAAELIVFYLDRGWSAGMRAAWDRVGQKDKLFTIRRLDDHNPVIDEPSPTDDQSALA